MESLEKAGTYDVFIKDTRPSATDKIHSNGV